MKRFAGQAGRIIGYLLHHTGMVLITLFFVLALAAGSLAFRFSLGPIQIPWITAKLAGAVSGSGINFHIASAALAWDGYKNGGGVPFYLQLEDVTASNAEGVELVEIPSAHLVFFPGSLLGTHAPILVAGSHALFSGSNVPVSLVAAIKLGQGFKLSRARLKITLGSGQLGALGYNLPINGGTFRLDVVPEEVILSEGRLDLTPAGADAPVVNFIGAAHLGPDDAAADQRWQGAVEVTANALQANDLGTYWPAKLNELARAWVTTNITTGSAHDGQFNFGVSAPRNLSSVQLDSLTGNFQAENLNIGWLPGAAPITGVTGVLTFTDKDTIEITASSGQLGGIMLHDAHMRINGVAHKDQTTVLNIPFTGSLTDALGVLNAPPLHFFQTSPPDLLQATGDVLGAVNASFPLSHDLQFAQVKLNVMADLQHVTIPVPLNALTLTDGQLAVQATGNIAEINGTANFAGEPAKIMTKISYGAGSPAVHLTIQSIASPHLLNQFGLTSTPLDDALSGTVPLTLNIKSDLAGAGDAQLDADFTAAAISVPEFGWAKKANIEGHLTIMAGLDGESVAGISRISALAPGLVIEANADPKRGRLNLTQLRIGASDAHGSITAPATPRDPWVINLAGKTLDINAILNPLPPSAAGKLQTQSPPPATPSGPFWRAKLRFDNFVLAGHGAPHLSNLVFAGSGQGMAITAASANAGDDTGQPLNLTIVPAAARETVHLDSADGGYLFRALNAFDDIEGGALTLDAAYGGAISNATGEIVLQNFRLLNAPAFTKLLQTLTIYGAADAASGPGLAFERLVAPFTISNHILHLQGARAFSRSLGFTASGSIAMVTGACDLDTTIVPAYALNSALGKIPVLGHLFSAEKGGGLFAVRAKITGQLTNPSVSVNPLSALTPGFLRGIFSLGGPAS